MYTIDKIWAAEDKALNIWYRSDALFILSLWNNNTAKIYASMVDDNNNNDDNNNDNNIADRPVV